MHLHPIDFWLAIAIACGVVKVLVTIAQVAWREGAMALTRSFAGRSIYVLGKVSPIGLVGALLIRSQSNDSGGQVELGFAFAAVCALVVVVVSLRLSGRWYGLAHMFRKKSAGHTTTEGIEQ